MPRALGLVPMLLAAGLLAGCGTEPVAAPAPSAPPLTAAVAQFREDEVLGQLRVRLVATQPMTVTTLGLDWPGLPGLPTTAPGYALQPGVAVDLPLPLVPAACGQPPVGDAAVPTDVAVALVAGQRIAVADPDRVLARVFSRSCRQQAVADAVSASFDDTWTPTDDGAAIGSTLRLRRGTAAGPVTVTGIDGSVLLTATAELPTTMTGDSLDLRVSVTSSGRCDGHALGESKQTFVFDVLIADEPLTVEIPAPARPAVWAAMLRACSRTSAPAPAAGS